MRVLVTAASRHGSTAEIAAIIAGVLRASDVDTDVLAPEHVATVVELRRDHPRLGGLRRQWLASSQAVRRAAAGDLADRPVFLFSSGPLGDPCSTAGTGDAYRHRATPAAMDLRVFPGRLTGRAEPRERLTSLRGTCHTATSAHGTTSPTGPWRSPAT